MKIVVVESPAKAKTINKYLGPGYEVLASFGHVRDLPAKDGSVDPEHDFKMLWEVDDKSNKRLNDIARARGHKGLAEEQPAAYKDVDQVVEVVDKAGISKKVARLRPVGVIKG